MSSRVPYKVRNFFTSYLLIVVHVQTKRGNKNNTKFVLLEISIFFISELYTHRNDYHQFLILSKNVQLLIFTLSRFSSLYLLRKWVTLYTFLRNKWPDPDVGGIMFFFSETSTTYT